MNKKIITIISVLISLICLFACNNKAKFTSVVNNKILMAGNDYIFDSEDVEFSDSSMSAKNVKAAIDELFQAINDGCKIGYEKGTATSATYTCNKRASGTTQTTLYNSQNVKYNKNHSGLSATNVKAAILEIAAKIPNCSNGFNQANVTSNSYDCVRGITITAKNQSVTYGTAISSATSQVTVTNLPSGYSIHSITLTPSTTNVTSSGTITPSAAVIYDSNNTNVTSNFVIEYNTGILTINKYTPTIAISATTGSVDYGSTNSFTATPTTTNGCVGTLTATSASATNVTVSKTSGGTYAATASYSSSGNGTTKTFYYKGVAVKASGTTNVTVSYVPTDTTNCASASTKTIAVTVNKVAATNPTLSDVSVTYDGSAHSIGTSGGSGGTKYYRTSTDNSTWGSWSTTVPSLTNVGKIYVQAYVKGDSNHTDTSATASKSITISQRTVTITAPTAASGTLTYSGSAQTVFSAAGSCTTGGTMYWYKSATENPSTAPTFSTSTWTTTAPARTATNAGTYYYYYYCRVTDTDNNTGSNINTVKSVSKAIGKYTPTLAISATTGSVTYGSNNSFTSTPTTISGCVGTLTATSASTTYVTVSTSSGGTYAQTASYSSSASGTAKTFYYKGVKAHSSGSTNVTVSYVPSSTSNCNSASTKTIAVTVNKAATTMSISPTSGTIACNGTATFTVTTNSDGTITCWSNNTERATCSVNQSTKKVTVTWVHAGTATVRVSQNEGTNHLAFDGTQPAYAATLSSCATWHQVGTMYSSTACPMYGPDRCHDDYGSDINNGWACINSNSTPPTAPGASASGSKWLWCLY